MEARLSERETALTLQGLPPSQTPQAPGPDPEPAVAAAAGAPGPSAAAPSLDTDLDPEAAALPAAGAWQRPDSLPGSADLGHPAAEAPARSADGATLDADGAGGRSAAATRTEREAVASGSGAGGNGTAAAPAGADNPVEAPARPPRADRGRHFTFRFPSGGR
jgi:hypothetical protein